MRPQKVFFRGSAKHCVSMGGADRARSTTHAPTVGSQVAPGCTWDTNGACTLSGCLGGCRMSLIVVSFRVFSDANCANRPCMRARRAATPRDEAATRPTLDARGVQGRVRETLGAASGACRTPQRVSAGVVSGCLKKKQTRHKPGVCGGGWENIKRTKSRRWHHGDLVTRVVPLEGR